MAHQRGSASIPTTPPDACPDASHRITQLEQQVRELQRTIQAMSAESERVATVNMLREFADVLTECFDMHAELIATLQVQLAEMHLLIAIMQAGVNPS